LHRWNNGWVRGGNLREFGGSAVRVVLASWLTSGRGFGAPVVEPIGYPRTLRITAPIIGLWSMACGGSVGETGETDPHAVINGTCAPHGESFFDQYSCDTVEGPAPTSQSADGPSSQVTDPDEDRLEDVDNAWTTAELAACSCICCHSSSGISGYVWSYEFEPLWIDSMNDERLLGFTDSGPGSGPDLDADTSGAADNNGFSRAQIGVPTTDRNPGRSRRNRSLLPVG
jgi:hypothetical protein